MESKTQQEDIVSWLKSRTYPGFPATPHRLDSARRRTRPEEAKNVGAEDWFKPSQPSVPRTPDAEIRTLPPDNRLPTTIVDLQRFSVEYGQKSAEKTVEIGQQLGQKRSRDNVTSSDTWNDYGQRK